METKMIAKIACVLALGVLLIAGIVGFLSYATLEAEAASVQESGYWDFDDTGDQTVDDNDVYGDYDGYLGTTGSSESCDAVLTTYDSKLTARFYGGSQWSTSADRVSINEGTDFPCTSEGVYVEAMIRLTSTSPTYQMIADQYQYTGGNGYGWSFYLTNNYLRFTAYHGDGTSTDYSTTITIGTSYWYVLYGYYDTDSSTFTIKIRRINGDGSYTDLQTRTKSCSDDIASHSAHPLTLGYRADGNGGYNPFHGYMNYVIVQNRE